LIELNGRRYRTPQRPTLVICVDGCDPEYLERGIPEGVFPMIGSFRRDGYLGTADAAMPTFTNPNNVSIVTGAPPSVHGIAGNYYLDRETGHEVMMTDERLMRSETILALMAAAGVKTAAVAIPVCDISPRIVSPRISRSSVIITSAPVSRSR